MSGLKEVRCLCDEALLSMGLFGPRYRSRLDGELDDLGSWLKYKGRDVAVDLLNMVGKSDAPKESNRSGSLVLFLLGLSSINPVKNGLKKEVCTLVRGDPPDIDTDFHTSVKQELPGLVTELFGADNVCLIGTYSTYKTRAVIIDSARVLGYEPYDAMEITKELEPLRSFDDGEGEIVDKMSFDELRRHYPKLDKYLADHTDILDLAEVLRDQIKNVSTHAAGVIVSDEPLSGRIPVMRGKDGAVISAWAEGQEKSELSAVGLVKLDLLGLNNLDVIADCVRLVEEVYGKKLDRALMPTNDAEAIAEEAKHDFVGIFQFENPQTKLIVDQIGIDSLADVAAVTSLIRPGPKDMKMDVQYGLRKNGEEYELPAILREVMSETYGVLTYQEQMMSIARQVCGFTGPQANRLRKACLTLDAEFVSLTRGPVSLRRMLKDGWEDDLFLQMGVNGKLGWASISDVWKTGKKRVRRTRTRSGYFVDVTRSHQFLTDDGWKAQLRLVDEDRLVCTRRMEWQGCDGISVDFMIVVAGIITEGHTPKKKETATFVNHDAEFMRTFIDSFTREFGVDGGKLLKCGRIFRIRASACKRIYKVCDRGLAAEKFIPDVMMSSTVESSRMFLSFMLGAEGGVSGDGHFEYSSKSERMIRQVRVLLLRFGIRSLFGIKNDPKYGKFYRLFVNDVIEQRKLQHLTMLWPTWKSFTLNEIIGNKGDPNFTTDTFPSRVVTRMLNQYPSVGNGESGTLYRSDISRSRFTRVARRTGDKEWIGLAESDFWFDDYSDSDEVVSGHMDVYDFMVADGFSPNMIVNGVVVHNCGKKIPEMMAEQERLFMDGGMKSVEAGLLTEEELEEIWTMVESFAGYGFNKCVDGSTVVSSVGGDLRVDEIEKMISDGKDVDLFSVRNGEVVVDKCVEVVDCGEMDAYGILIDNGWIEVCSLDHQFLCKDGVMHTVEEIAREGLEMESVVVEDG